MILDLDSHALVIGIHRGRFGDGPTQQHAVYFETQIPVMAGSPMLVHHEHTLMSLPRRTAHRFRCAVSDAFFPVSQQRVSGLIVVLRALVGLFGCFSGRHDA